MADQFRKVKPGDRLPTFPSVVYNGAVDCIRDLQARKPGFTGDQLTNVGNGVLVTVRNDSGGDVNQYAILQVDDFLISPSDRLQSFKNQISVVGIEPAPVSGASFVICQAPIRDGALGPGLLLGASPCQVNIIRAEHTRCDLINGDATKLKSCLWGPAEIIVKPSGTGTKWCYVSVASFHRAFRFRGVTAEAIAEDAVGDVDVYVRTSSTGYTATGETAEALNDLDVDVESGATVEVIFDGLDDDGTPFWRLIEPDYNCPPPE